MGNGGHRGHRERKKAPKQTNGVGPRGPKYLRNGGGTVHDTIASIKRGERERAEAMRHGARYL